MKVKWRSEWWYYVPLDDPWLIMSDTWTLTVFFYHPACDSIVLQCMSGALTVVRPMLNHFIIIASSSSNADGKDFVCIHR